MRKVMCENRRCGWRGDWEDTAHTRDPFDDREDDKVDWIHACPKCVELRSTLVDVCEEPDCWEPVTMGTPYPGGYKRHCHKHPPQEEVGV